MLGIAASLVRNTVIAGVPLTIALALAAPAPSALQSSTVSASAPPSFAPLVCFSGPKSRIEAGPDFRRITDVASWEKTWNQHAGETPDRAAPASTLMPEIDFSRCMVIAIFRGKSTNSNGEHVVSCEQVDDHLLLRFDSLSYQTLSPGPGDDKGVSVTPFGIFVLPRTTMAIVIEENVQGLIGGPPIWKQRHRFDPFTEREDLRRPLPAPPEKPVEPTPANPPRWRDAPR